MKNYLNILKDLYYKLEILTEEKEKNKNKIENLEKKDKRLAARIDSYDKDIKYWNNMILELNSLKEKRRKHKNICLLIGIISSLITLLSLNFGLQIFGFVIFTTFILNTIFFNSYSETKGLLKITNVENVKNQIEEILKLKENTITYKKENMKEIELCKTVIENVDLDINKLLENISQLEPLFSKYAKEVLKQDENKIILSSVINSETVNNEKNKVYMKK